ncbi:DNA polymerase [Crocinitomicaceae bacterium]|nr:DNA polymerase [Crocinitomicaceae bacterium]
MSKSRRNTLVVLGTPSTGRSSLMRAVLAMQAGVVVMDDLVSADYSELEERILAHCGSPLGNVATEPSIQRTCYEERDYRFNQKPEKSTFTRKVNRSTKRW